MTNGDSNQRHDAAVASTARMRRIEALDLSVPIDLPIASQADTIIQLLRERSTIVVSGETGSGKSTQLPKLCLAAGLGRTGFVGHTQPRRIAARSIAQRLAEELHSQIGDHVGFKIRFADQTKTDTLIKLMTDGVLLAETQSDRQLKSYDAIIIDEAHERSLNIDFLLGYLRRLRQQRPSLRTIITSATIDAERFADHFADASGPAPIVVVEGRSYPVEIRHRSWEECAGVDDDGLPRAYDLDRHVISGIDEILQEGSGDILVFLPTEHDIREVSKSVAGHFKRQGRAGQVELLPLYARLPQSEQTKIFNPSGQSRRIVFATNVAESSLTVPGIRYVIDSGTARISRYSPRSKVQRLPIEAISQASARQRAGRCGRVAPGICIRLFTEEDFLNREAYTTPEIRRTNLASVILQTKVLKLGAVDEFPFIDPPRPDAIREGYRTLIEIGALDDRRQLTAVGRQLGRMPVDPRVGRMILAAEQNGVLPEVLVIAAALEIQDPRDRPPDKKQAADEAQSMFQDPISDFVSYLRLWHFYEKCRENLSKSQLEKAMRSRFLSPNRMREWADVYRQLRELIRTLDRSQRNPSPRNPQQRDSLSDASVVAKKPTQAISSPRLQLENDQLATSVLEEDRYALVHQSLLAGLLSGAAMLGDKNEYTGSGGLKLFLWPGSGVFASKPKWIVAAELVETSRTFARCVGRIQPDWLENVGAHLVKHNYSDPHWSEQQNGAFCYERVSLFGLPIVARRRIPLAPIDPSTARSLMIEQGLVEGKMQTRARAVIHNRALQAALADLAAKTRRRDLIIDPYRIQQFYEQRLPESIVDRARLEQWDRKQSVPDWAKQLGDMERLIQWLDAPPAPSEVDQSTIYMRPEALMPEPDLGVTPTEFPDELVVGETRLPLSYRFEPGAQNDGITITVPQAALPQVSDQRLGWLVPGLLEEKIQALIKSLPKRIRRNLVPAADTAKRVSGELAEIAGTVPFMSTLCRVLSNIAETKIEETDFDQEKLPEFLKFHIEIVNDQGAQVARGRSVQEVRKKLNLADDVFGGGSGEMVELRDVDLDRDGLTTFDMETLPVEVVRLRGGVSVAHFPTLIDRGAAVDLRVMADRLSAEQSMQRGLMRLFAIAERKELRSQVRWLPEIEKSRLLMAHTLPPGTFEENLIDLLARRAFVDGEPLVRTQEMFAARRSERAKRIAIATQTVALWLPQIATAIHAVRQWLESNKQNHLRTASEDVRLQVDRLLTSDFLQETPWEWLQHYPRYFKAMEYRLDKLRSGAVARDAEWMATVADLWQTYERIAANPEDPRAGKALEARWLIEELRVSLFAQPLGTATKVSPQRIEKLFA